MKDFLGNELQVGDEVVFAHQNYRKLCKAKITGFTKLYVNIEWMNYKLSETRQLPEQLIKVIR